MARPNQEAIDTFMSITGAAEAVALQKLEEHGGDLNEAVNAYFSEGDRNIAPTTAARAPQDDLMAVDNDPLVAEFQQRPFSLLPSAPNLNPFSLLDANFRRSFFEGRVPADLVGGAPRVTHPREVREIPIEVKDGNNEVGHSGSRPTIEEVSETAHADEPEIRGHVILNDDDDEDIQAATGAHSAGQNERSDGFSGNNLHGRHTRSSVPVLDSVADCGDDIEEEMIQAAIEASKREVEGFSDQQFDLPNPRQSHSEDAALAHAVSLSLKTAEREKVLRQQGGLVERSEKSNHSPSDLEELGNPAPPSGRQGLGCLKMGTSGQSNLEAGSSFIQDEAEDVEELPLVRQRSRRETVNLMDSTKGDEEIVESPPPNHELHDASIHPQHNGNFDEWGGISSEEHDEAVMLEAAIFGGIPEGTAYNFGPERNTWRAPRPPSPTLAAQRLIREQQDDEYFASLQADREKELKAMEEAEARRLEEQAAVEAAREEGRRKLQEEEEMQRQLVAKEASLPQEPAANDENAVTLLVRMPDGSRRGRRFLKSDKLQCLFDFIDVGKGVKPGTYRLVRPYPRRAFSVGESSLSLMELGLTSKQEALFLELI